MSEVKFKQPLLLALTVTLAACAGSGSLAPLGRKGDTAAPQARVAVAAPRAKQSSSKPAYVPGQHRVTRGETLYSIAWRYGHDFREVAEWNNVRAPFTIYPGQVLKLSGQSLVRLSPTHAVPEPFPPGPKSNLRPASSNALPPSKLGPGRAAKPVRPPDAKPVVKPKPPAPKPAVIAASNVSVKGWGWPTNGKVIRGFKGSNRKGVDFGGSEGQAITAAAPGNVVYSGSGLRGYGQLIIIKHNKNFLSAYAHNKKLHVREGDKVVRGQRIADMGRTGTERVKLHFEIRKNGKPVDPFGYLPRNPGRR